MEQYINKITKLILPEIENRRKRGKSLKKKFDKRPLL